MAQCNGTTENGNPCQLPAGWGTDSDEYCVYHAPTEGDSTDGTDDSTDGSGTDDSPDTGDESDDTDSMTGTLPRYDSLDALATDAPDLGIVDGVVYVTTPDGYRRVPGGYGDPGGETDSGDTTDGETDDGSTDDSTDSTDDSGDETTWPQTLTIEADAGASWEAYAFHIDGDVAAGSGIDSGDEIRPHDDGTTTVEGGVKDGKVETYTIHGPVLSQSIPSSQTLSVGEADSTDSTDESGSTDGESDSTGGTASDAKTHITFDGSAWRDAFAGVKDNHNDTVSSPARSGEALRVRLYEGNRTGANMHYRFADNWGARPDEVHVRYWLYLGENWGMGSHDKSWATNGGKLPGFADLTHGSAHGGGSVDDSWSVRGSFRPPKRDGDAHLGWYWYLPGKDGGYGSSADWNGNAEVNYGEWVQIDQYVAMNDVGQSNGTLRAWVDGEQAYENTSLRFRTQDDVAVGEWWLDVFMGGGWTPGNDMCLYIDDVKMWDSEQL